MQELRDSSTVHVTGRYTQRERAVWMDLFSRTEKHLIVCGYLYPRETDGWFVKLRHWINKWGKKRV